MGSWPHGGIVVPVRPGGVEFHDAVRRVLGSAGGDAVLLVRVSPPTPVSADLAHAVVDALAEAGCSRVVVGVALDVADRDRGHASAEGLAFRAGLRGRTARGHSYEVRDLREDLVPAPVPDTSVLAGRDVARLWGQAGVRAVLGRAVTDLVEGFAGALAPLVGAAASVPGARAADVVADLLAHLPPRLAVVDATSVSHGPDGARLPLLLDAGVAVVAGDALDADCALAGLLGEDRSASSLVARALAARVSPPGVSPVTRLDGVRRVHPFLRTAARALAADPQAARLLAAGTGGPDEGADAVDPLLSAVRAVLTPLVRAADEPAGRTVLAGVLRGAAALAAQPQAWAANLDKDAVRRCVVPLGFDPADHTPAAYEGLPAFFAPFAALLDRLPAKEPMRYCFVDGATVFEVSRLVPAEFDVFVARVDVAEGISLMADYVGGRRVVVGQSAAGTHQAERNLYLAQPNYLALAGGQPIDVCKIELVERGADEHRLTWRTVASPNGSAGCDDGVLTFTRTTTGTTTGTQVTIRGRQRFTLPPAWTGIDLATMPEVRDPLLEEAYRRFFTTTFDNLEACFEGRAFRIGRDVAVDEPLLTASLQQLLSLLGQWLAGGAGTASAGSGARSPVGGARSAPAATVDAHGFRHVRGTR